MGQIDQEELLALLQAIETGQVTLKSRQSPQWVDTGSIEYAASNGWTLHVYNDANEWDYLEAVKAPDGRSISFDEMDEMVALRLYAPSDEVAWQRYGIPQVTRGTGPRGRARCEICEKTMDAGASMWPMADGRLACEACSSTER